MARHSLDHPSPTTGKRLVDDPAVAGLEVLNEDSYFFWSFAPGGVPDARLRILEAQFGDWLKARYGSIGAAFAHGKALRTDRDRPTEGRVGFRLLWNMAHEKTPTTRTPCGSWPRASVRSTRTPTGSSGARVQRRDLGVKLGDGRSRGPGPARKIHLHRRRLHRPPRLLLRQGRRPQRGLGDHGRDDLRRPQRLRFEPEVPGGPRQFVHPAMDVQYDGKPSMISETTWTRPNRYRSEAPCSSQSTGHFRAVTRSSTSPSTGPPGRSSPGSSCGPGR